MNSKQEKDIGKLYTNLHCFGEQNEWISYKKNSYTELCHFIAETEDTSFDNAASILANVDSPVFRDMIQELIEIKALLEPHNDTGKNLIDEYLMNRSSEDSAFMQSYLLCLNNSTYRIWEAVNVVKDKSVELKVYGKEGPTKTLFNKSLSNYCEKNACYSASIVEHDGEFYMSHSPTYIPQEIAKSITAETDKVDSSLRNPSSLDSLKEGFTEAEVNTIIMRISQIMCLNFVISYLIHANRHTQSNPSSKAKNIITKRSRNHLRLVN